MTDLSEEGMNELLADENYIFDEEFIELARSVYKLNDKRAEIKRKINEATNSSYREVKLY